MGKKILIVVDMQNDFVDGSLGTKEARAILPAVEQKVATFPGEVIFTQDTHQIDYLKTQEGQCLPVEHCIKGTAGWELVPSLKKWAVAHDCTIFPKPTFGSTKLAEVLTKVETLTKAEAKAPFEYIELIGLCTDICVISNALLLKAALPEVQIKVDSSCCAGVTPQKHQAALEVMRSCQIIIE